MKYCSITTFIMCFFFVTSCINYKQAEKIGNEELFVYQNSRLGSVTVSLYEASIKDALEFLPDDMNVIYDSKLNSSSITLDVVDMPYLDYIYSICKNIEGEMSRHGTVFVLKKIVQDEKKGFLGSTTQTNNNQSLSADYTMWMNLKGWKEEEISSLMGVTQIKWVVGDTWIYRGNIEGAIDLSEALDILRRERHCDYYFEIYFLSSDLNVDFGSSDAFGMDLDWRRTFAKGMTQSEWNVLAKVTLKTIAELSRSNSAKIVSGVVREGVQYQCKVGDSLPFVSRAISDQGTVTDTDVKYESVGFNVGINVKGASVGIVDLQIDSNDVAGYQQGYAIKHGSNLKTTYSVNGNDIRYVGSFFTDHRSSGLLSFTRKLQMWDVFVRIERLSNGQYMRKNHIFFQKKSEKN